MQIQDTETPVFILLKENIESLQQSLAFLKEYGRKQVVWIHNSKWQNIKMSRICQLLQEWRAKKIWAYFNKQSSIIKQIEDVNFPHLNELSISGNNITSIEGLQRVRMPALEVLNLNDNDIVSFQPLRKCSFPNLSKLVIKNNFLSECGCLTELRIRNEAKALSLNYYQCGAWILKVEAAKIKYLWLWQNKRSQERNRKSKWRANCLIGQLKKCAVINQY